MKTKATKKPGMGKGTVSAMPKPEGIEAAVPGAAKESRIYPVVIGAEIYNLSFNMEDLIRAEQDVLEEGWRIMLVYAFDVRTLTLEKVRTIFGATVRRHHPGLRFEDALKLVDVGSFYGVATVILNALADAKEARMPKAAA